MPKLTVEGFATVEVEDGKRLVLAIEQDADVDVLHACGGNARCTTCRVEFIDGEPAKMTVAEKTVLAAKGVDRRPAVMPDGLRSRHDRPRHQPLEGSGRPDPRPHAAANIPPPPEWIDK